MKENNKKLSLINTLFFSSIAVSFLIFAVLIISTMYEKYSFFSTSVQKAYKSHLVYQKDTIKQRVDNLAAMLEEKDYSEYDGFTDQCTREEREILEKGIILNLISKSRYGTDSDGYFYIIENSTARVIMHPIDKSIVGRDIRTIIGAKGRNIGMELYQSLKYADNAFFTYYWDKPSTGEPAEKLVYARFVPKMDWIIVTGIYLDDFREGILKYQRTLKGEIIRNTVFIILKLILILIIFWVILFFVKNKFINDLKIISSSFGSAVTFQKEIDSNSLLFKEFAGLADYLNIEIKKNSSINKKLRYYAEKDSLTDLYNRRMFMENLDREFSSCKRYKHSVSLLMLDLDHFKNVNDTYGHAAGDLVLKEFAQILDSNIRDVDISGRLGGEEFGVIMPNTEKDKAVYVAERIRKAVEEKEIRYEDRVITLTVSIGVASIPPEKLEEPEELLKIADVCLYRAKSKGRNKVEA